MLLPVSQPACVVEGKRVGGETLPMRGYFRDSQIPAISSCDVTLRHSNKHDDPSRRRLGQMAPRRARFCNRRPSCARIAAAVRPRTSTHQCGGRGVGTAAGRIVARRSVSAVGHGCASTTGRRRGWRVSYCARGSQGRRENVMSGVIRIINRDQHQQTRRAGPDVAPCAA